jgi:hypothetical protein
MHFNIISLVVASRNYVQFLAAVIGSVSVTLKRAFSVSVPVTVYNMKFRLQISGTSSEISCLCKVIFRLQNNSHRNESYFNKLKPNSTKYTVLNPSLWNCKGIWNLSGLRFSQRCPWTVLSPGIYLLVNRAKGKTDISGNIAFTFRVEKLVSSFEMSAECRRNARLYIPKTGYGHCYEILKSSITTLYG